MMNDLLSDSIFKYLKNPYMPGNFRFYTQQMKSLAALYLFYMAKQQGLSVLSPIYELLVKLNASDEIKEVLIKYLFEHKEDNFSEIQDASLSVISALFKKVRLVYNYTNYYPEPFNLALNILQTNPEESEKVAIFYQNPAIQDITIPEDFKNFRYQVFTNKREEKDFLLLRREILQIERDLLYESIDLKNPEAQLTEKFSKIFAFPPIFQKRANDDWSYVGRFMGNIERGDEDKTIFYIQRVIDSLKENGKAVVLVSNAFLTRNYSAFHEQIIDKMILRRVIHLPAGIIGTNNLMSSLLVFEKNPIPNFDGVRFVDARSFDIKHQEWNKISPAYDRNIPYEKIKKNDYNLNQAFYKEFIEYTSADASSNLWVADSGSGKEDKSYNSWSQKYYVKLLASSSEPRKRFYTLGEEAVIFKCFQDKSSIKFYNEKVDPSQNSFLARYLRISDIQDNRIQDSMSYIVSMDRDLSEYELRARDVLIAKVLPVKTTMLAASDNRRIYPDGNFFIIRLKEDSELSPAYLKGYLESKAGKQQLEKLASGGSMLAITKGALERLEIPYKTRTEQEKYTRKYNEYENQIQQLQQQIQETKDKIEALLSSNDQNEED